MILSHMLRAQPLHFVAVTTRFLTLASCLRFPCLDPTLPHSLRRVSLLQTLEYFSLNGINKWAYVGYESLFFVGFFFAAWAALQFIRYDKR